MTPDDPTDRLGELIAAGLVRPAVRPQHALDHPRQLVCPQVVDDALASDRADIAPPVVAPSLTRDQRRSLWLHAAVAGRIVADPGAARELGRRNLQFARAVHTSHGPHAIFDRWAALLDGPLEDVLTALLAPTAIACDLRQNTPFAGLLSEEERLAVHEAFIRDDREHTGE